MATEIPERKTLMGTISNGVTSYIFTPIGKLGGYVAQTATGIIEKVGSVFSRDSALNRNTEQLREQCTPLDTTFLQNIKTWHTPEKLHKLLAPYQERSGLNDEEFADFIQQLQNRLAENLQSELPEHPFSTPELINIAYASKENDSETLFSYTKKFELNSEKFNTLTKQLETNIMQSISSSSAEFSKQYNLTPEEFQNLCTIVQKALTPEIIAEAVRIKKQEIINEPYKPQKISDAANTFIQNKGQMIDALSNYALASLLRTTAGKEFDHDKTVALTHHLKEYGGKENFNSLVRSEMGSITMSLGQRFQFSVLTCAAKTNNQNSYIQRFIRDTVDSILTDIFHNITPENVSNSGFPPIQQFLEKINAIGAEYERAEHQSGILSRIQGDAESGILYKLQNILITRDERRSSTRVFNCIIIDYLLSISPEEQPEILQGIAPESLSYLRNFFATADLHTNIPKGEEYDKIMQAIAEVLSGLDRNQLRILYIENKLKESSHIEEFCQQCIPIVIDKYLPKISLAPLFFHYVIPVLCLHEWEMNKIIKFFIQIIPIIITSVIGSLIYGVLRIVDTTNFSKNSVKKFLLASAPQLVDSSVKALQENPSMKASIYKLLFTLIHRFKSSYTIVPKEARELLLKPLQKVNELFSQESTIEPIPRVSILIENIQAHDPIEKISKETYSSWIDDMEFIYTELSKRNLSEDQQKIHETLNAAIDQAKEVLYQKNHSFDIPDRTMPLLEHISFIQDSLRDWVLATPSDEKRNTLKTKIADLERLSGIIVNQPKNYRNALMQINEAYLLLEELLTQKIDKLPNKSLLDSPTLLRDRLILQSRNIPNSQQLIRAYEEKRHWNTHYTDFRELLESIQVQELLLDEDSENIDKYKNLLNSFEYMVRTLSKKQAWTSEENRQKLQEIKYSIDRLKKESDFPTLLHFHWLYRIYHKNILKIFDEIEKEKWRNTDEGFSLEFRDRFKKEQNQHESLLISLYKACTLLSEKTIKEMYKHNTDSYPFITKIYEPDDTYGQYIKEQREKIRCLIPIIPTLEKPDETSKINAIDNMLSQIKNNPSFSIDDFEKVAQAVTYIEEIYKKIPQQDVSEELRVAFIPGKGTDISAIKTKIILSQAPIPHSSLPERQENQLSIDIIENAFNFAVHLSGSNQKGPIIDRLRSFAKGDLVIVPIDSPKHVHKLAKTFLSEESLIELLGISFETIASSLSDPYVMKPDDLINMQTYEELVNDMLTDRDNPIIPEMVTEIATQNNWVGLPKFLHIFHATAFVTNLIGTNGYKKAVLPAVQHATDPHFSSNLLVNAIADIGQAILAQS